MSRLLATVVLGKGKTPRPMWSWSSGPRGGPSLTSTKEQVLTVDVIRETSTQPSFARTAYENAARDCRDIAAQVGIRNCENDPDWRAAEYEAEQMYALIPKRPA